MKVGAAETAVRRAVDTDAKTRPANALALRDELRAGMQWHEGFSRDGFDIRFAAGWDSFWAVLRRGARGGCALRLAYAPGGGVRVVRSKRRETESVFEIETPIGLYRVEVSLIGDQPFMLRSVTTLTPSEDVFIPHTPRDLYLLDERDDPLGAEGEVKAAQRGVNTGLVYFTFAKPMGATALYLQDLTALNDYFEQTGSKPDGAVGGYWPELGYQPPSAQGAPSTPKPLQKGRDVIVSKFYLQIQDGVPADERESARAFLDLLANAYRQIEKPPISFHDWPGRAEMTLRHLRTSPKVTETHFGDRYVRPYTDAEHPDCMAQLTVVRELESFGAWRGKPAPLLEELRAGVGRFYNKKIGAIVRYLPDVGDDKDADEVDSWYLYHPLMNLGRLAQAGDKGAAKLFFDSMDYAIRVARRFKYTWPVKFNVNTLKVIQQARQEGQPGQSDVGGVYAYVMLQAHALSGEKRYLTEAERAVQAMSGLEFELEYQSNLTAWGAAACLRLWKLTSIEFYRNQSYALLATFFHNCILWKSEIGSAKHFDSFLGASCLHDGPYMAMYECWESFAAFQECFAIADGDLAESVSLLMTEYIRHALSRAWFYYPSELPEECLAKEIRNGHIDRKLSMPLEDLYAGGEPAGQVGQEVYGAGAAFAFATHAFHQVRGAPFLLFCDTPAVIESAALREVTMRRLGSAESKAIIRLIPKGRTALADFELVDAESGETIRSERTEEGHIAFEVKGPMRLTLSWSKRPQATAAEDAKGERLSPGQEAASA